MVVMQKPSSFPHLVDKYSNNSLIYNLLLFKPIKTSEDG